MTPEPNAATFLNPMMWLLAQVQALFGLSFAALFQWWRVAAALVMGPALAVAAMRLSRSAEQARVAFWIALAGGGLGWVLVGAKYALGLADAPFPEALYIVEPNTWYGLMAYPYLPLAQGFMLIALVGAFRVHTAPSAVGVGGLRAGRAGRGAAPRLRPGGRLRGGRHLLDRRAGARPGIPWRFSWAIVVILVCSAPLAGYYQYLTSADPLWRSVLSQYVNAGVWTPAPPLPVILLGAPLVLAAARLRGLAWEHDGTRLHRLLDAHRRGHHLRADGLPGEAARRAARAAGHPRRRPVVLAPAPWLSGGRAAAPAQRAAIWAPALVLALLVLPTNLYLLAWRLIELRRPTSDLYVTADESAALDTLAVTTGPGDVALAVEAVGRWVPNQGRTRAYLAHWAMTNRYLERRALVDRFFSSEVDDAWRQQLWPRRVTYVVWTDRYRQAGGTFSPAQSPLFEPIYVAPTAGVFKVRGGAPAR